MKYFIVISIFFFILLSLLLTFFSFLYLEFQKKVMDAKYILTENKIHDYLGAKYLELDDMNLVYSNILDLYKNYPEYYKDQNITSYNLIKGKCFLRYAYFYKYHHDKNNAIKYCDAALFSLLGNVQCINALDINSLGRMAYICDTQFSYENIDSYYRKNI